MDINPLFLEIGIIIIVATFFAFLARLSKQPLIPAYVIAGLILGPLLHLQVDRNLVMTLSEMGIAFLLFIVGLELDLRKLKSVGVIAIFGGLVQCIVIFAISFIVMSMLGFSYVIAAYVGVALAFSSTMVVVKILSDKRELDTLHGRIIVGILLMQDFLAIIALPVLTSLDNLTPLLFFYSIGKVLVLFAAAWLVSKYVFTWLFKVAASLSELLFLAAISVCFLFSYVSVAWLGFSVSVGAFVAGVSLANLPYGFEIIGRVKSIRDFFSTIFFVSLGMSITFIGPEYTKLLIILLVITVLVKPFVVLLLAYFFGFKKRVGFLSGLSLGQTSEFSLILAAQGMVLGHLSSDMFSVMAILTVTTMALTSYFLKYESPIYAACKKILSRFEPHSNTNGHEEIDPNIHYDVLLVGYDRIGYSIVKKLNLLKKKILIVDYNPDVIKRLAKEGINGIYGDIADQEIMERINLKHLRIVISTSPDNKTNLNLLYKVKQTNPSTLVFLTSYNLDDALLLYDSGADYIILPHFLGGEHVSLLIEQFTGSIKKFKKKKAEHIKELRRRKEIGHYHPVNEHAKGNSN